MEQRISSKKIAPVLWISPPFQALFPRQLPRPSCSRQLPSIMRWCRENQPMLMYCPNKTKDCNNLSWFHHNKSVLASPQTLSSSSIVSTFFWLLSALSSAFFSSFSRFSSISVSPGKHYYCLLIFITSWTTPSLLLISSNFFSDSEAMNLACKEYLNLALGAVLLNRQFLQY